MTNSVFQILKKKNSKRNGNQKVRNGSDVWIDTQTDVKQFVTRARDVFKSFFESKVKEINKWLEKREE